MLAFEDRVEHEGYLVSLFIHSFIHYLYYITLIYLHVVAIVSDVLDASSFVSEIKHCTPGIKHCILTCMNE